jgi:hypothetical protein
MSIAFGRFALLGTLVSGSAVLALQGPAEALQQIGLSEESVQRFAFSGIAAGTTSYPSTAQLRRIPVDARAALVPVLGSLVRTYVESGSFANQYREYREAQKPEPPEPPSSTDEDRRKYKEDLQRSIQQSEETLKSMPAEYREGVQQAIEFLKEQLKAADDPDNPMFSSDMDQYKQVQAEAEQEEYRNRLARWEQEFPEDPRALVRMRLQRFLEVSAEVDFSAAVKPSGQGRFSFENPVYERKPGEWKALYRAGQAAVEAAREFARKWHSEL